MTLLLQLHCPCGAVQLEVRGEPLAQFFCHCDDCQIAHGAAYVPESLYPAAAVTVTRGTPFSWAVARNPRHSCPSCGTRLFVDVLAQGLRGVNGYLLPAGTFQPSFHMQCRFAVRPIVDDLPHFHGLPEAFGGSDDVVDW
jgi:hypothetical protein